MNQMINEMNPLVEMRNLSNTTSLAKEIMTQFHMVPYLGSTKSSYVTFLSKDGFPFTL